MDILSELEWRGLVQDVSDREGFMRDLGCEHSFYIGYDPTAPSLQIGNFVPITISLRLAKLGLRAIQLFGGATGAIGDPSGRNVERKLLNREVIDQNVANHSRKVKEVFDRAGVSVEFVNNYDWTAPMGALDFLREVGKHFPMNYMLNKEVVKARLEGEGISFTEFSYMLLQANDFLELYRKRNCRLQVGGSDQWGNITAGLELIRRKGLSGAYALSFPLLLDSQGRKFGKSESGTLWLDPSMTSPYRFHQYWLNQQDADVIRYLKVFTFLSREQIQELEEARNRSPEKREAQRTLADEVTTMLHGEEATRDARRCGEVLFGGSLEGLSIKSLEDIFREAPSSSLPAEEIKAMTVVDAFAKVGLAPSKGEARRLASGGGLYVNNRRVTGPEQRLEDDLNQRPVIVLRAGKKNYHLLKAIT